MNCFCGGKLNELKVGKFNMLECNNCGYLCKKDLPSNTDEKNRYDMHVCDEGYLEYMNNVFKQISTHLNKGLSLDYGCGQVHALADIMNNNGCRAMYYDLYYYNDLPSFMFDNIVLIEVFEHISNPVETLNKLKSMLNSNGKIIIMTQSKPADFSNWWYLRDITHVSFFNEKSFSRLAEVAGMKLTVDLRSSLFILTRKEKAIS